MKEIYNNSYEKSVNGKPINYKNRRQLDINKTKKFAITAGMIIVAVALSHNIHKEIKNGEGIAIVEEIQNSIEEKQYNNDLENALNNFEKSILDTIEVPIDPQTKRQNVDLFYSNLADSVVLNKDLGYIFLHTYINRYGYESNEIQSIVDQIAIKEGLQYTDITDYLYNKLEIRTKEEFDKYCLKLYDERYYETKEEIEKEKALDAANDDLTTFWVCELQKEENPSVKIYEFYNRYHDEDMVNELVVKYGFSTGKDYTDLTDYLIKNGYNSIEEWVDSSSAELENNNGRVM